MRYVFSSCWALIDFDDTKTLLLWFLIKSLSISEIILTPKAKASLSALQIQHPVEGSEFHKSGSESWRPKYKPNRILRKRFESPRKWFESLSAILKQKVRSRKRFESQKLRIWISKWRCEEVGNKAKGFESLWRIIWFLEKKTQTKNEEGKKFESPTQRLESLIWKWDERAKNT